MASSERTAPDTTPAAASTAADTSAVSPASSVAADKGLSGNPSSGAASSALEGFRVDCLMNARYHSAREAFLDGVHRWLMFGIIVFGSAVVIDLFESVFPSSFVKALFAAFPVILGALDLTFDLSNRARIHAQIKRRYFELLADVAERMKTMEQAEAAMHRCSADEEPAYHALLATAWNAAQEMVYGDRAKHYKLSWWERGAKQFRRFEGSRFPVAEGASS